MNHWLQHADFIRGWLYEGEPEFLYDMAVLNPELGDILEIGSWMGKSSVILGGAVKDAGGTLYCVDTFRMDGTERQVEVHKQVHKGAGTFYQFMHNIDIAELTPHVIPICNYSHYVLPRLNLSLRLVFIDATHNQESLVRDLTMVAPMVGVGGLILCHDIDPDWPGMEEALRGWMDERKDFEHHGKAGRIAAYRRV